MKIPLRIAFLLAPWCFVWLIAIGCSRQGTDTSRLGGEPVQPFAIEPAEPEETKSSAGGEAMLARYRAITQSDADPSSLRQDLGELYREWGERAGEAAVRHALEQNRTLLPKAFAGWAQSDRAAPVRWVLDQVDHGRSKRNVWLASGLLHSFPPDDHEGRSEWVARIVGDAGCEELVAEVAISWGIEHPQQALDWLEAIGGGDGDSAAAVNIFHSWVERDPGSAAARLTQMPAGMMKDRAISSLARVIDRDDPETARLWAGSIVDQNLRQITTRLLGEIPAAADEPSPGLLTQAE
ncbi:MAG: hypothetical protein ACR2RV_05645 [Verrucomicrobiales bacterium]